MPSSAGREGPGHATRTADPRRKPARGGWRGNPLLAPELDFKLPTKPTVFYVVAATARSGSTFLCRELWSTGLMGAPLEYFNVRSELLQMTARVHAGNIEKYVPRLFDLRTSPNGVFGFKAGWDELQLLSKNKLLPSFPNLRYVYIERSDRLAQAVSYAKAHQTRQYRAWNKPRRAPVYDYDQIRFRLRRLEQEIRQWTALFERNRLNPIKVTYESLAENPRVVVDDILQRFGFVRDPTRELALPPIERQGDAVNQEWIERFRRENSGAAGRR